MKYLDSNTPINELQNYFVFKGWLNSNEQISRVETPGDGNMNVVLRILTNTRTFIVKQSRPFVQKYQQIEAPLDRISVEHQFYDVIQNESLNTHIPKILGYDASEFILVLEDLGHCQDMSSIYENRDVELPALEKLIEALGLIHQSDVPNDFPENLEMRHLNHQHIFILPFLEDNGFQLNDIQEGLQNLSTPYKKDSSLKKTIHNIGQKYLSKDNTLLHGDYYPGSWMTKEDNLYIIDPEFGFPGFPEFDLGVMAGHIIIATGKINYLNIIYNSYSGKADQKLMKQVAGIEIMRRLIGLAQLPLNRTLPEKQYLLEIAQKMIMS